MRYVLQCRVPVPHPYYGLEPGKHYAVGQYVAAKRIGNTKDVLEDFHPVDKIEDAAVFGAIGPALFVAGMLCGATVEGKSTDFEAVCICEDGTTWSKWIDDVTECRDNLDRARCHLAALARNMSANLVRGTPPSHSAEIAELSTALSKFLVRL